MNIRYFIIIYYYLWTLLCRRSNPDGHESPTFSSSDNNDDDDDDGNSEENTSERSHREGGNQLFSSLSSENLQQELNKCTSDGLSDKENVVRRMRHQVNHIPGRLQVGGEGWVCVWGGGRVVLVGVISLAYSLSGVGALVFFLQVIRSCALSLSTPFSDTYFGITSPPQFHFHIIITTSFFAFLMPSWPFCGWTDVN